MDPPPQSVTLLEAGPQPRLRQQRRPHPCIPIFRCESCRHCRIKCFCEKCQHDKEKDAASTPGGRSQGRFRSTTASTTNGKKSLDGTANLSQEMSEASPAPTKKREKKPKACEKCEQYLDEIEELRNDLMIANGARRDLERRATSQAGVCEMYAGHCHV